MGRGNGSLVGQIVEILRRHGHQVTTAPTTGPRTAGGIAHSHIAAGADLVVALGGDGTINEVAEGMVHSSVPLAILPAGTANVLATEMRMGSDPRRAAVNLAEWLPRRISVGKVTFEDGRVSRHFLLMAGAGLDALMVYRVNTALKDRVGKLAYYAVGARSLGDSLAQVQVEIEGRTHECSFALLSKVRNYGGDFEIASSVHLSDDQFEAVLFEGRNPLRYVGYFVRLALNRLAGRKGVTTLRTCCAKLASTSECVYVQVDGELAGRLPAEVRLVRDAITLLVPEDYWNNRPEYPVKLD